MPNLPRGHSAIAADSAPSSRSLLGALVRDGVVYGVAGIAARGATFLLIPVLARYLAPSELGLVDVVATLAMLATVLVGVEVSQGVARYVPGSDRSERLAYGRTATTFALITYAGFVLVAVALAAPFSRVLVGDETAVPVIRWAAVSTAIAGVFLVMQAQLRASLRPWSYALVSLVYTAVTVIASIAAVALTGLGAVGVFMGSAFGAAAGLFTAVVVEPGLLSLTLDRPRLRRMLTFAAPLAPASLAFTVMLSADRLVLGALRGYDAVGVFGVAARISASVSLLMVGVQLALTPLVYERFRDPATPGDLAHVFRMFAAAALGFVLVLALFAPEIVALLAPPEFAAAASVIPLLAPAILLSTLYVFAPGLGIAERSSTALAIHTAAAALNVTLNVLLVPLAGIAGAAAATLASSAALFAAYVWFSQRTYPVPHHWPQLLAAALVTVVLVAAGMQLPAGSVIGVTGKLALAGLAGASYVVLGLVPTRALGSFAARSSSG